MFIEIVLQNLWFVRSSQTLHVKLIIRMISCETAQLKFVLPEIVNI